MFGFRLRMCTSTWYLGSRSTLYLWTTSLLQCQYLWMGHYRQSLLAPRASFFVFSRCQFKTLTSHSPFPSSSCFLSQMWSPLRNEWQPSSSRMRFKWWPCTVESVFHHHPSLSVCLEILADIFFFYPSTPLLPFSLVTLPSISSPTSGVSLTPQSLLPMAPPPLPTTLLKPMTRFTSSTLVQMPFLLPLPSLPLPLRRSLPIIRRRVVIVWVPNYTTRTSLLMQRTPPPLKNSMACSTKAPSWKTFGSTIKTWPVRWSVSKHTSHGSLWSHLPPLTFPHWHPFQRDWAERLES